MTTRFLTLFTLEVTHAYYDGACRDFTFLIPADTAAMLKRGRLMVRVVDGRLFVLFEADETGRPVVPAPGAILRLGLQLTNASFANFTAVTFALGSELAVYANGAAAGALDAPVTAVPAGRFLTQTLAQAGRPVDVTMTNAAGQGPKAATVTDADQASASLDLVNLRPGRYTLVEHYPAAVNLSTEYYLDPELSRQSLFGIVEIAVANAFYAAAPAFTIAFDAKEETLKYYVVAHEYNDVEFGQLGVAQSAANGPVDVTFSKKLVGAFTSSDLPATFFTADGAKVALFQSDAVVKRRVRGYPRIELSRNGEVIIGNLPQVAADRPTADLIVHLSKPKP